LLAPQDVVIRADTLICWVEHQAVWYWGAVRGVGADRSPRRVDGVRAVRLGSGIGTGLETESCPPLECPR
jgi:hypothetical protein